MNFVEWEIYKQVLDRAEKAEAANTKLMAFLHKVEVSADRAYLRTEAWKLIEELEGK